MRKLIISVSTVIMIAAGATAHAQMPVTDTGNLVAQAKNLLQELKSYATQLQQLQQEVQSVTWAAQTAQSFIQNPNLGAAMALMNMVGIENPLPINPYAVQSLVSGYGGVNSLSGLTGKLSSLNGLVTDSYSADRVYNCADGSYACARQQQVAYSNAGIKGLTSQIYQQLTEHIPVLQSLRTQLGTGIGSGATRANHGAARYREHLDGQRPRSTTDRDGARQHTGECAASPGQRAGQPEHRPPSGVGTEVR